jgi:rare lipoprotein A
MLIALIVITATLPTVATGHELEGYASWYAGKFQGRTTASGEVFDTNEMTAAHKTLPFGTIVEVTHLDSGRTAEVRINDRGPFVDGRVIDLSRAAAERIGMTAQGIARVTLRVVALPEPPLQRIQVASFSSQEGARRLRDRLRAQRVGAEIEDAGTVFRVVVPGLSGDEARQMVDRLSRLGYDGVLVRTE